MKRRGLPLLLASFSMLGPFSIDTVLPAFQRFQADFGVGTTATQQIISVYILAFAAASLFHGPISDALGRKPVVLVSLFIFAAASVASMWAPNFTVLLALRAVQGMFAGASSTVGRAIVRDVYDGAEAGRVMSTVMMIFGIAPAIAPVVGGALLTIGPWEGIYVFLAGYSTLLIVAAWWYLPETHPVSARVPFQAGRLMRDVWRVGSDWRFLAVAASGSCAFAGMFLYVGSAAIVITDLLGKGEQDFWLLFTPLIGGMILGSFISNRLAGKVSPRALVSVAFVCGLAAAVVNVGVAALWADVVPVAMLLPPGLIGVSVATAFPTLQLAAIDMFPEVRGAAASVTSFVSLIVNALTAGALAPFITRSFVTLACAALCFVLVGFVLSRVCVAKGLLSPVPAA